MVHDLKMPLALAGLQIDADQAFSIQVVAGAFAAVVVGCRRFHGQIYEPEVFVDRHLRPDAGVAVGSPRTVLPGLIAEFAGTWNRVERPGELAGPHVVGTNETLGVVVRGDGHAL